MEHIINIPSAEKEGISPVIVIILPALKNSGPLVGYSSQCYKSTLTLIHIPCKASHLKWLSLKNLQSKKGSKAVIARSLMWMYVVVCLYIALWYILLKLHQQNNPIVSSVLPCEDCTVLILMMHRASGLCSIHKGVQPLSQYTCDPPTKLAS